MLMIVGCLVRFWCSEKLGKLVNIAVIMPIFIQLFVLSIQDRKLNKQSVTLPCLARACRKLRFDMWITWFRCTV